MFYAHQVPGTAFTQLISKLLVSFEIHWVRQYRWTKDLYTYEMTIKLKSNLSIRPVNDFPNFLHWNCIKTNYACHITEKNSLEEFALNLFKVIMLPFLLVQRDPNEF